MYISVGDEFLQPKIVFRGENGRNAFEQILNTSPKPTDYMKSYAERLARTSEKIRNARSKPDYK